MSGTDFELHPRLAADTATVCDLGLSRVLLMDDITWPWLILVPRRTSLRELVDLPRPDRHRLDDEVALASHVLLTLYRPDKLNVAALGNVVEQLHVHVIARHVGDPAWPAPVWGRQPPRTHAPDLRAERVKALRSAFAALAEAPSR
ncbi:HIT family protein [Xanthomonadaceae bacterium XH05]|nr:HIT family protein [Xanthomonadaceae bacterium XH05]